MRKQKNNICKNCDSFHTVFRSKKRGLCTNPANNNTFVLSNYSCSDFITDLIWKDNFDKISTDMEALQCLAKNLIQEMWS